MEVSSRNKPNERLDAAPSSIDVDGIIAGRIGNEKDRASGIELDKRGDASDVRRLCVLDRWGRKSPSAVVFNVDDIG